MNIGNVEINGRAMLAPMAGVADRAFRELCVDFGASYVVSEMVSSKGIIYDNEKTTDLMEISEKEHPAAIQLFGDDPKIMASAAKIAQKYNADVIDINMGCPAPKIISNNSGSSLMKKPKLCGEIVSAVKAAIDIPVTVKIRKGWDNNNINAVEVAKICELNGADAIAIHARTRQEMYNPGIDLEIIKQVKKAVTVPVIGNGDITSAQKAKEMIDKTGCDFVMIGRAALGNPWLFSQINEYLKNGVICTVPDIDERIRVIKEHIGLICKYKGERHGMKEARKHVGWYMKGLKGAAEFRRESGMLESLSQLNEICQKISDLNK